MDQKEKVAKAVKDKGSLDGMRKSFGTILERQQHNAGRIPDLKQRQERLREVKEKSVGNEELLNQAVAVLQDNGFRVVMAKNSEAALRLLKHELKDYDLVVKSKSNVSKEIHLTEVLEREGKEVVETDLGDRIVQLAECRPAHPTGPACHLTRGQISTLFSEHFGKAVSDDPAELTRTMREEIASYISRARVGITGANAIAANEGAVVIVHNEGNAAKCAMLPDKHIILATPEKIVPSLDDAINLTKVQTFLSTGKIISSYINVITGPSYTADIEKQIYRGMHGPKEVLIVLIDDGRLESSDKGPQHCIGCGMCLLFCPSYNILGPEYGTPGHMGGQGLYLAGTTNKVDESLEGGLFLCTSCGACTEVCPTRIDTKKGISSIRESAKKSKKQYPEEHGTIVSSVRNYDNPWLLPRKKKGSWAECMDLNKVGPVLYFSGCSTALLFPESARRVVRLLRSCGIEPAYLGEKERCCGSTLRKIGESRLARDKAEQCFDDFKAAGAKTVVTSCPGCSSALNYYADIPKKHGIEVVHLSQFLAGRLGGAGITRTKTFGRITYHDPCDLGRAQGVYDEPRRLLAMATGSAPLEMSRTRELSACCGSGSGVRSAYPQLADAIASERIEMAIKAGADTLVTSCPWCVQSLAECQGTDQKIRVVDLTEVLEKALGRDA
ncbi:MAG TPA: LUD domain-containing protein [Thermoplasmata archaeon]